MTLEKAKASIGKWVRYEKDGAIGTITIVNERYVFVKYSRGGSGIATSPQDLRLLQYDYLVFSNKYSNNLVLLKILEGIPSATSVQAIKILTFQNYLLQMSFINADAAAVKCKEGTKEVEITYENMYQISATLLTIND